MEEAKANLTIELGEQTKALVGAFQEMLVRLEAIERRLAVIEEYFGKASPIRMRLDKEDVELIAAAMREVGKLADLPGQIASIGRRLEAIEGEMPMRIQDVGVMEVQPGDLIVVRSAHKMNREGIERLKQTLLIAFDGTALEGFSENRVIVLDEGMALEILSATPEGTDGEGE
jgi:hypothetical protein